MAVNIAKEDIKGFECRHAFYRPSAISNTDDLLVVKEYVHTKDGKRIPNVRLIPNYKRDFWITRTGFRNHEQKKEWEDEEKLRKFTCTQAELTKSIAKALGLPYLANRPLRYIARNPYVYGCDITTPPLVKKEYDQRWPDCITPEATMAVMDIETDVVEGHGDIIIKTISFKDKVFTGVLRSFLGSTPNAKEAIHAAFERYMGQEKKERNIKLEVEIFDTAGEIAHACIQKAHEWMPDFVTFWNIDFDMPHIIKALEKGGYDLPTTFSDPSVPPEYKHFKYIQGKKQKVTASGKVTTIPPADRWHMVDTPASWYMLDSMCLYRRLRLAEGQEPSFALDAIMKKHIKRGKLKFEEADGYSKLDRHKVMQSRYKIEYIIYNIFDCVGVELLDEKIGDISRAFNVMVEYSEYNNFKSTPTRIADDMHFYCRENGRVIASCSEEMVDELDKWVMSMVDWIVTLPAHMSLPNPRQLILNLPAILAFVRIHNFD